MKTIIFRTLGGHGIGFGHYFRSYSLATALINFDKQLKIIFVVNKQLSAQIATTPFDYFISESFNDDFCIIEQIQPQLFILDSYLADNSYLITVKKMSKVMIFDDNNDIYDSTIPDILLNGNIHSEELVYRRNVSSLYLLGPQYLVMREEYWRANEVESNKEGIVITTGGTDPYEISYYILLALSSLSCKKRVVIGPGYEQKLISKLESIKDNKTDLIYRPESLRSYIREAKVAVTSGGSTVYEVISQNTTPVIFNMADNQDLACRSFANKGIMYIGKHSEIQYNTLLSKIENILEEKNDIGQELSRLVDGQGVKRIVETIRTIVC